MDRVLIETEKERLKPVVTQGIHQPGRVVVYGEGSSASKPASVLHPPLSKDTPAAHFSASITQVTLQPVSGPASSGSADPRPITQPVLLTTSLAGLLTG